VTKPRRTVAISLQDAKSDMLSEPCGCRLLETNEMSEKKRPMVVKILVLIVAIGSIIPILAGSMMLTGGSVFEGYFMQELLSQILPTFYVVAGVIGLVVAWGLWMGKGWAWLLGLIIFIIGIVMDLLSLPTGIVGVVIDGIVVYLLLRSDTRRFCGK
jgi:hypothetical protein